MVLPASDKVARALPYSGTTHERDSFAYGTLTPYGGPFQKPSAPCLVAHSLAGACVAPQPRRCRHPRFGLVPVRSPLLRKSRLISSPSGTEMFHFPPFAPPDQHPDPAVTPYYRSRVSPFGHPRLTACLTAPRGVSPLAAPFIACPCLGILRMP
jgi:hypothetical protein